jgi:hypothetical protein
MLSRQGDGTIKQCAQLELRIILGRHRRTNGCTCSRAGNAQQLMRILPLYGLSFIGGGLALDALLAPIAG